MGALVQQLKRNKLQCKTAKDNEYSRAAYIKLRPEFQTNIFGFSGSVSESGMIIIHSPFQKRITHPGTATWLRLVFKSQSYSH